MKHPMTILEIFLTCFLLPTKFVYPLPLVVPTLVGLETVTSFLF